MALGVTPAGGWFALPEDHRLVYVASAVGALALGGLAFIGLRRWRALYGTPALVEGAVVSVTGVVRPVGEAIEAPLSGRRCVVHRSRARAYVGGGLLEPTEHAVAPFDVETAQGRIRVQVAGLGLAVVPTVLVGDSPAMRAFRARHAVLADHDAAFDEVVIEPGQRITIRGLVAAELDASGERGYREAAPRLALLVAPGDDPVTIVRVW